jgi:transcription elongation factor S-II
MDITSSDSETSEIEIMFDNKSMSNYITNLEKFRKKGLKLLLDFLPFEHSKELEFHIYDFSKKYIHANDLNIDYLKSVYKSKISDIHFNLDQKNSNNLLSDILNKKILLNKLPYVQCNILNPQLWDPIIKKKEFIEYKKENMCTSDAYECKRCKERKCKVFLLQTRSADEPMTVFIQCENCNSTFKIY